LTGRPIFANINRNLDIELPSQGPRTLNGLILEHMEFIPEAGTSLKVNGYPIEIMQIKNNMVKTARIAIAQGEDATDDPTKNRARWLNRSRSISAANAPAC